MGASAGGNGWREGSGRRLGEVFRQAVVDGKELYDYVAHAWHLNGRGQPAAAGGELELQDGLMSAAWWGQVSDGSGQSQLVVPRFAYMRAG